MSDATWTTKDGRVLLVENMDNQHLKNTILYLRRNCADRKQRHSLELLGVPASTDWAARQAFKLELETLASESPREWLERQKDYQAMVDEADWRSAYLVPDDAGWVVEAEELKEQLLAKAKSMGHALMSRFEREMRTMPLPNLPADKEYDRLMRIVRDASWDVSPAEFARLVDLARDLSPLTITVALW